MKTDLLIFGAGVGGDRALRWAKKDPQVRVMAYIDNDKQKWGTKKNGLRVISPDEISGKEYNRILIASVYSPEILTQLVNLGYPIDRIDILEMDVLEGRDYQPSSIIYIVIISGVLIFGFAGYGVYRMIIDWFL